MTRADAEAGAGDRLALAVLVQYRMATKEQMHLIIAPRVRIEQTRRRLAKLRAEGLVDRITLPQAGCSRVWFATRYGVQVAGEWPELRGRRPLRLVSDPVAARLQVSHTLTVTETGLQFLLDARRREEVCRPLDFLPEVHHPIGGGEAVIPDALLYYQRGRLDGDGDVRSMLRAFLEVDRATMGPERLAAKLGAYARFHRYAPLSVAAVPVAAFELPSEEWRRQYPLFPRLLFVLDGTGAAGSSPVYGPCERPRGPSMWPASCARFRYWPRCCVPTLQVAARLVKQATPASSPASVRSSDLPSTALGQGRARTRSATC
ncbi:replication-relaxation family protein [Streptomyces sp. NPDC006872]|uniref:replication-relaxation family protein n=1 Tax=Streptomyces sp. NPDC006872 TaxID=3155720 RepID=UPI0033E2644E